MKKSNTAKPTITKQTYAVAKSASLNELSKLKSSTGKQISTSQHFDENEYFRNLEAEVMGEQTHGAKSDIRSRNSDQMIAVLRRKLNFLEFAAKERMNLCHDDLDDKTMKCSKQYTKITDEYDDMNYPKLKDNLNKYASVNRDNNLFLSSNDVHADAVHLVLRTKGNFLLVMVLAISSSILFKLIISCYLLL
jgi:hypothetical protein